MDARYRPIYNAHFSDEIYRRACVMMDERLMTRGFEFRLAETPLMLPPELRGRLENASREVLALISRPDVIAAGERAIPDRFRAPRRDALPHFVSIDFAVVREADGSLGPRLIELQGFSSLYGMTFVQAGIWSEILGSIPGMPPRWTPLFSGLHRETYLDLLRRTVIADADPDEVILLDIDPATQKTRPDFHATARFLGVRAVCVSELAREGRRLLAPKDGRMIPVKRVLHRVVFDELDRRKVEMRFDYRDDLDVVWVSHPAWYWIWSKDTLLHFEHPSLPITRRLSDLREIPSDLSRFILKPLFSYAGQGVHVDIERSSVDSIPASERPNWLLQEKVVYAPALMTPEGIGVKAEIRMMFLQPDGAAEATLAINLTRLSRGKMHGVDHNKGLDWIGSSVAIWPEED